MNYFIILVLIVLFIMLSNLRAENDKLRQDKEREQRHIDYSEYTQKQKQHEYLNELRIELSDLTSEKEINLDNSKILRS